MMALKRRDDICPIQVPIGCKKKLSKDEKVRFSVAPDGWSSSSSGEDNFVDRIKRKRSLQPRKRSLQQKKTSGRKHKKKCVSVGSENEGESCKKGHSSKPRNVRNFGKAVRTEEHSAKYPVGHDLIDDHPGLWHSLHSAP